MKKIVFVVNYFHPEYASTGQLMTDLCLYIQNDYEITVVAAQPSYTGLEKKQKSKRVEDDSLENIKILRVRVPRVNKASKNSRIRFILSYTFNSIVAIQKIHKPDIIFALSQPPILGGILGVVGKLFKRSKLVYCIEDFNPEQAEAIAYNKLKFINSFARFIDNISCNYSDQVVVVGDDMRDKMYERNKRFKSHKMNVINNWVDEKHLYPLDKNSEAVKAFRAKHRLDDKFVIMYSGNIGLYYDLENIIKVLGRFKDNQEMQFVFIGEGAIKNQLCDYVEAKRIKNISFLPYQDRKDLIISLNSADVHIVCNQKGIKGVSVPSKIYGVLSVAKPILGILEKHSESERIIRESVCGKVVEPHEYDKIEEAIQSLYDHGESLREMGQRGYEHFINSFTMEKSLDKYRDLFNQML